MNKNKLSLYWWLGLAALYAVLSFLAPADKNQLIRYHLSIFAVHAIDVSVIVPVVIILFLAYVGYYNLKQYYRSIGDNPDGKAFKNISIGIGVFAYATLVSSIITTILKWIAADNSGFLANSVRLDSYLSLIVPLVAFWLIADGVGRLVTVGRLKFRNLHTRLILLLTALLGVSYGYVTFHQDSGLSAITGHQIYFMPEWVVLLTIAIPYVFAWSIGLLSFMQIITYRQKIKGVVYRETISLLANGLGIILISYVVLEYLTSLYDRYALRQIGWLLVIVYCFLVFIGIGYLFIAIGARRLKRIEEV